MKRLTPAIALALGLITSLWLVFYQASPVNATGPDCASTYVVQWGDTLFRIALRTGTSVWELANLNGINNVNRIYAGQILCLPGPSVGRYSSFDLIVEYTFDREADPEARRWTVGRNGIAGLRVSYPLLSGDMIDTYSTTLEVRHASVNALPSMWLVRASATSATYTLVVFGDPRPLLNLQMETTPTQNIADIISPPNPDLIQAGLCPETDQEVRRLSLSGNNAVRLRAELVGKDGTFVPVDVAKIDYHQVVSYAVPCYQEIGFALHSTPNPKVQGYRLLMVLTDDGTIGPPGRQWRLRCASWTGGGWWSRWRRAWFGCR